MVARVSTRANKDQHGLIQRSNVVDVMLEQNLVVQAITPPVPKNKKGRRSQIGQSKAVQCLNIVDCHVVGLKACICHTTNLVGPDPIVPYPIGLEPIEANLIGLECISLVIDIVSWQTLFGKIIGIYCCQVQVLIFYFLTMCLKVRIMLAFLYWIV